MACLALLVATSAGTGVSLSVRPTWADAGIRADASGPMLTALASIDPVFADTVVGYSSPSDVTLTANVSNGVPPYTLSWDFGDGSKPSAKSPVNHSYAESGTYLVLLTVQDHAGASSTSTVIARPVVATGVQWFTATASATLGSVPLTVDFRAPVFTAYGPVHGVDWSFGDGQGSPSETPSHTYTVPGTYLARATAQFWNGTTNTFVITIRVGPLAQPVALAIADPFGRCLAGGATYEFANLTAVALGGTGPYTYTWTFGDGNGTSGALNVIHQYEYNGTYTAVAQVEDANATVATASVSFHIWPPLCPPSPLFATITANRTRGTAPFSVAFTATVVDILPLSRFSWDFGDGGAATTQNASHTFMAAGNFTVVFQVFDSYNLSAGDSLLIQVSAGSNSSGQGEGPPSGNTSGPPPSPSPSEPQTASLPWTYVAAGAVALSVVGVIVAVRWWRRDGPSSERDEKGPRPRGPS